MELYVISLVILLGVLTLIIILSIIDYYSKKKLKNKPFVSIIVSCYNDKNSIEETIKSVYDSYNPNQFELFIIDDKSTDGSILVLKKLKKKYKYTLIENENNIGKSQGINNVVKKTKSDLIFVIDSDVIINKKSFEDLLSRLEEHKNIAAVSCPCKPKNKEFWATMQHIEYNMTFLVGSAYNPFSCLNLCGAFLCFRKKAFLKVGGFSVNAIIEDMDLALKLNESGFKVKQAHSPVLTYVPIRIKEWYKQKLRWSSGVIQCIITHFKTWIKHPLHMGLICSYSFIIISSVFSLINDIVFLNNIFDNFMFIGKETTIAISIHWMILIYGTQIILSILEKLSFSFFSLPYVFLMIEKPKYWYRLLLCFPFSLMYFPFLIFVALQGFIIGILKYNKLKKGVRAW